ncbi:MAG: DNA-directed RNA polymerase subunit alpha [Candidatus Gottesmanbacteria bacterium GW2011_GWA1_43_11]|uniref:DNA-directed RNA polymerase subunit alpha n=1 Tax=Candidatus Gottesmanbacteria bacterium GW2011_GWA1_43_11 TaxID=1618436 RepID=A0A0G1FCP1_9BACT|nr:MAG: DNA-directed RNA polymerase subunit alpha [Candidatus Gottesmanbacteria bacterium GW2011_GWA1_43_11]
MELLRLPANKKMTDPVFKIKGEKETESYGKYVLEPLAESYGHTLGNALRRVLLSSMKGAAITSVKIDGVKHQFTTLPGLKEDIVEFLLNLKKIRLFIEDDREVVLRLTKKSEGEIFASDIEVPAGVKIVNPDHYLGTLSDKKSKLEVEMTAQTGYGYVKADQQKNSGIGVLQVDSVFSPVTRVNYKVEATRVGRDTNLDKLIMEIWTDGTVAPRAMLEATAQILVSYFVQVYEPRAEVKEGVAVTPTVSDEILKMRIEELDIPTRIVNALANGGIETVGQLLGTPRTELAKVKNLGGKSLAIVDEKLREKGVALSV